MRVDLQRQVIIRLHRAAGHLKKVEKMISEDRYCIDILQQSLAVQAALREIDKLILRGHLLTCVARGLQGQKKEEISEEIVTLFEKARK